MRNRLFFFFLSLVAALTLGPVVAVENSSALYKEGAKLALQGNIDQAIVLFQKVVQISPYSALGYYGLGKAYLYKPGKLDLAVLNLKKSVELDKSLAKGYFYLGMAHYLTDNYVQAIHAFKKAYDTDYTWIESLFNIGVMYDIIEKRHSSNVYFNKYFLEKEKEKEEGVYIFK